MKKLLFSLMAIALTINSFGQANSKNPYDSAGKIHNDVVTEFLTKYGSQNLSTSKTIELTNAICDSRGMEGPRLTEMQFNAGMKDIKNNFKETVSKSSLSSNGKIELQRLFDYMVNGGFKGGITIQESTAFILNFEDQILANKSLTQSDKKFILESSSVARYSTSMWNNIESKSSESQKPRWIRWLIVAAADVAGGVAGGGAFSVPLGAAASTTTITVIDQAK